MGLLSHASKCNLLFAICISDFAILPFWGGNMVISIQLLQIYTWFLNPIFFLTGNKLLANSLFNGWTFLVAPFFNISLTFSSPILCLFDSLLVGEWFLTEKVLNKIEFCTLLLCPLGSCVIFIQAPTKCFNLPADGTSGILFGKNNLFING